MYGTCCAPVEVCTTFVATGLLVEYLAWLCRIRVALSHDFPIVKIFISSIETTMKLTRKQIKIIYRTTTIALTLFILPGLFFMNGEMAKAGMAHVGLTDAVWLQQLIGFGGPIAILLILIPQVCARVKEWAYVGLGCIYIGAFWAHVQLGDPISMVIMPVITFAILYTSYMMRHKGATGKVIA